MCVCVCVRVCVCVCVGPSACAQVCLCVAKCTQKATVITSRVVGITSYFNIHNNKYKKEPSSLTRQSPGQLLTLDDPLDAAMIPKVPALTRNSPLLVLFTIGCVPPFLYPSMSVI